VPSIGLPLLAEYRCYPSTTGVGLNSIDISLAINSSALPAFRAYSTGGTNRLGTAVRVNPDTEEVPLGGFNPNSNPPGRRTAWSAENAFYIGQVDYVTRVSRVHTAWLDTGDASPQYLAPVIYPPADSLPLGTRIVTEYRGALSFITGIRPDDAQALNAYGEPVDQDGRQITDAVHFLGNSRVWRSSIDQIDGARYFQLRLSFLSNLQTGLSPELDALGVAFSFD